MSSAGVGQEALPAPPPGEPAALSLLIVDDDEVDRMTVRRALRSAAVHAIADEAATAPEAERLVRERRYDCIFLDYNIPGSDGLALLASFRQLSPGSAVVMLTGQGDEQTAVRLMKAGAVDYLPKAALSPERLASSLRYAVELTRSAAVAQAAELELREGAARARFLAEASAALTSSLDRHATSQAVASLAVPFIADCCVIYGLDEVLAIAGGDATLHDQNVMIHAATLEVRSEPRGAMVFMRTAERGPFTSAERELVEDLGQRTALAFENVRLYEAAERARRRTARLQRVTARLATALPQADLASMFVEQVQDALQADKTWVALLDTSTSEFVTLAHAGFADGELDPWRRFPVDSSTISGAVLQDAQPRWFANRGEVLATYPALANASAMNGQASLGVLPIGVGSGVFGVMSIGFGTERRFAEDDRALAVALAGQFAQALERSRLFEAQRDARERAETANRAKSEFLARMSHDLRTPLNAIGGYAELVEMGLQGPVTEQQRSAMGRIVRAKDHLLTLINDILSFAKLEAGQITIAPEDVALPAVAAEVQQLIASQVAARGLSLRMKGGPACSVRADRERLVQVLLNLLTNSVKFTDEGHVELEWEPQGEHALIHVRDTGRGIDADRLATIFEPFVQVSSHPGEAGSGGVGLGLAISRELLRLMDGRITAESEPGVGSTFTIHLPLSR